MRSTQGSADGSDVPGLAACRRARPAPGGSRRRGGDAAGGRRPSRERIAQVSRLFSSTWLLGAQLLLEQRGLSLSDQDLLSLFHETLRRLPHRLRPESYFRGQHRAAEEMGANGFGEVLTTPRAHVRATSAQDVGGEFHVAKADVAGRASGDDMTRAVHEDQRALLRCQDVGALAVHVRQSTR